jgi:hypothetical protein
MSWIWDCVTLWLYVLLWSLLLTVSPKQMLLKLSADAVVVMLLKITIFPEGPLLLQEQFKSSGPVSIYSTPSSSQFNVHYIPQKKITTSLHPCNMNSGRAKNCKEKIKTVSPYIFTVCHTIYVVCMRSLFKYFHLLVLIPLMDSYCTNSMKEIVTYNIVDVQSFFSMYWNCRYVYQ